MGAHWLYELPDVAEDAGLEWRVWPGWENRSRSSGGYDQMWAVFVHHTASDTSPDNDCRYMWDNAEDRPIGAILLERSGRVTIGAAGATNCQGKGGPYNTTRGTIPVDKGNAYGIAVEAQNDGVGEMWPAVMCDAYTALCAALCDRYGLSPARDVVAHWEWTTRKVDPAGPSPWAFGRESWDMAAFRGDVASAGAPLPPQPVPEPEPEPEPEELDVLYLARLSDGAYAAVGSAVRPVSPEELGSGALGTLTTYQVPAGSLWHDWIKAGLDEYTARIWGSS